MSAKSLSERSKEPSGIPVYWPLVFMSPRNGIRHATAGDCGEVGVTADSVKKRLFVASVTMPTLLLAAGPHEASLRILQKVVFREGRMWDVKGPTWHWAGFAVGVL